MKLPLISALLLSTSVLFATASPDSINLGNYTLSATYALDVLNGTTGGISGLEGSAIAYARDRGTLFFVGDEGTGVVEISLTGQTIGSALFDFSGTGSIKHDTEGLTYLGNGVLVSTEERLQDAYRYTYAAGSTISLVNNFVSISNTAVGNSGIEGITYDPRDGSFITIKQQSPQNILAGTLTFAPATGAPPSLSGDGSTPPGGGVSTMTSLFDPTVLGLTSLSDVQTLSPVDALAGTAAANNLLILSLGSRKLLEVDRTGAIKSSYDLSTILPDNAIEGVTVDQNGTIYLIAEQDQTGTAPAGAKSQLIVLSAPEPSSIALFGLAGLIAVARRRGRRAA